MSIFNEARPMLFVGVLVMIAVLLAMIVDLISGIYKAKQRGELRTSTALRRTLSKFISYHGGLVIALLVDMLIAFLHFYDLLGIEMLHSVPVVTIIVGIFLLVVEFLSVREKADAKTKHNQAEAAKLLAQLLTREDAVALLQAIVNKGKESDNADA